VSVSILRKTFAGYVIVIGTLLTLISQKASSQSPVEQFTAAYYTAASTVNSYTALPATVGTFSSCNTNSYTYTWSNGTSNQLKLLSFTANSRTYIIASGASVTVKLRRVNNAVVTGVRSILYSETTAATAAACVTPRQLDFKAPYNDDMAQFLNNNVLNHGTDNIFTNASNGDGNNNNIERVDVIFNNGISSSYPAEAGFVLCERGNVNAHDGFRICAILSLDGSGNPASFGAVKTCVAGNGANNGSWGHPTLTSGNKVLSAYVLRKDPSDTYLRVSSNVNQELGGVFFSLADLGVTADQNFYGYALLGPDGTANPTSAQLLNTSDPLVYPTGTTEAAGGGLDLISINTFYGTHMALALNGIDNFAGQRLNDENKIEWNISGINNGDMVTLQTSGDGVNYRAIYNYQWFQGNELKKYTDQTLLPSYYRLMITKVNGTKVYSKTIFIQARQMERINVYPTIVRPAQMITISNLPPGNYSAQLFGQNLYKIPFSVQGGKGTFLCPVRAANGLYILAIENYGKTVATGQKIIIQNY
jgi:hypothetical protein